MIYLDNAATTRVDQHVLDAMLPYLKGYYGNAGGLYGLDGKSKEAIKYARESVAGFINADAGSIVFTSGGSESNSMAIHGVKQYLKRIQKTHIIVSSVEHESVISAVNGLIEDGFDVEYVGVSGECVVSAHDVESAIRADTGLVSVMFVNNETGAVNPVREIGEICRNHGVIFHTDCVQAAGDRNIDVHDIGCDMLSMSSHKIHGPKGVGCLYVRDKSIIRPVIYGGRLQEFGVRGGTENVPGIVGFGRACRLLTENPDRRYEHILHIKRVFYKNLINLFSSIGMSGLIHINGRSPDLHGKTISITIDGVDGQSLVLMLDSMGVCVSAGSACNSREVKGSHVLMAMGLSEKDARSTIRVSFSKENSTEDALIASQSIFSCVSVLIGRD